MEAEPRITFHEIDPSEAVRQKILEKVAKISQLHPNITGINVTVESPHRQHKKGNFYFVHIHAAVPGGEVVVSRNHNDDHGHEDIYVAVSDAFGKFRRRLDDFARRSRGETKRHESTVKTPG